MINQLSYLVSDAWHGKPVALRSSHWPTVEHSQIHMFPNCAACLTDAKLEVHHILPFHLFPEFELTFKNLLTLCRTCHYLWGHGKDWKAYIPRVRTIMAFQDDAHRDWVIRNRIYVRDDSDALSIATDLTYGPF